jgi:hypothetical protein
MVRINDDAHFGPHPQTLYPSPIFAPRLSKRLFPEKSSILREGRIGALLLSPFAAGADVLPRRRIEIGGQIPEGEMDTMDDFLIFLLCITL